MLTKQNKSPQKSSRTIKKVASFALLSMTISTSFGVNFQDNTFTLEQPAQAQTTCDTKTRSVRFTALTSGSQTRKPNYNTNIRSSTTTTSTIVTKIPPNTRVTVTAWKYGQGINDIWTGKTDYRWYQVTYNGRKGWVASGVISGNAPNSSPAPNCSPTSSPQPPSSSAPAALKATALELGKLQRGEYNGRKLEADGAYPYQCVDLVKWVTNTKTKPTSYWKRGENVMKNGKVAVGSAVAIFNSAGSYNHRHTAIFAGYGTQSGVKGFYVWSQNAPTGAGVRKHFLPINGNPSWNMDADEYFVIKPF
ncbi:MAG: SH3 domain-containing protein [Limnothrix sp. RL_2_0]|nr:SH3 domain-containing protein [Limnothrix sp. RL_2_0]